MASHKRDISTGYRWFFFPFPAARHSSIPGYSWCKTLSYSSHYILSHQTSMTSIWTVLNYHIIIETWPGYRTSCYSPWNIGHFGLKICPCREKWYLVLHPPLEWGDWRERQQNHLREARSSALHHLDGQNIIAWFAEIFRGENLANAHIATEWKLKSPQKTLLYQQWREFLNHR